MEQENGVENDLYLVIQPIVEKFDSQVKSVRLSQVALREKIDLVASELKRVAGEQPVSVDLDPHIRRLVNSKRRVVLASNIVQNVMERLARLQRALELQTRKTQRVVEAQRALIDVVQQLPSHEIPD